jgi:hypothetical protein
MAEPAEERSITITFDSDELTWDYETGGNLNIDQTFSDYTRTTKYQNTLVNGLVTAYDAAGRKTVYQDGCHLVREESGRLITMSKPEYVEYSQRKGTENED